MNKKARKLIKKQASAHELGICLSEEKTCGFCEEKYAFRLEDHECNLDKLKYKILGDYDSASPEFNDGFFFAWEYVEKLYKKYKKASKNSYVGSVGQYKLY